MRLVNKNLSDIPSVLTAPDTLNDLELIAKGKRNLIDDKIYKGTYMDGDGKTQSSVRDKLNDYYFHKCAYCEMPCKAEIEHYRPKLGVTGIQHDGYYWLCYEWSNLVPSCRYCNTEGGKGNQFPIFGKRVKKPSFKGGKLIPKNCQAKNTPLKAESPELLHPELDSPKKIFAFKVANYKDGIEMDGIDKKSRGKYTIKICNLNRPYAKLNRIEAVLFGAKAKIDLIFDLVGKGLIEKKNIGKSLFTAFKQLEEESRDVKLTHTLFRSYIIQDLACFLAVFAPYIDNPEQRKLTTEAFKQYISQK